MAFSLCQSTRFWISERRERCFKLQATTNDASEKPKRRGELVGKTGKELRDEFFMAALTGSERGLPNGAFLNDNSTGEEAKTEILWEPYGEKCTACQVRSKTQIWKDLSSGIESSACRHRCRSV